MNSIKNISIFFILSIFTSLMADTIIFSDGRVLEDVKVKIRKDTVEVLYKNGKREVRKKTEFKKSKIKLIPVAWGSDSDFDSKKSSSSSQNVESEIAELERQIEANFAIPPKLLDERRRHDFLMKERIRLQYTEGLLTYAGGQQFYTEIMQKNNDRYFVRNQFGLLFFNRLDFGDEMVIETDNGKEVIDISKIQAVKDEKFIKGFIYLSGAEKIKGTIKKNLGDQIVIETLKGELRVPASDVLFPPLPPIEKNTEKRLTIKQGEAGNFLLRNGDTISGKLVRSDKTYLIIETEYGMIEIEESNVISFTKGNPAK
ncbi:MAG TPA: hypothetical protein PK079_21075 [Leptospiraceae bacterium]|nr:hypothetical protein [Leptospiraceae bacterium]HMW07185.1 hypothetical protein [Leptospiraceae bacterium]HMX33778.1 hypothetical protein [Leptospiraceae bacterium]HMY32801.1 hypothetical protein [Leptospiraceae bacterium]HNA08140.1 hypothetical protein [Leptospiraceae bacterium]